MSNCTDPPCSKQPASPPIHYRYKLETTVYGKWIAMAFQGKTCIAVSFGQTKKEAGKRLKTRRKTASLSSNATP